MYVFSVLLGKFVNAMHKFTAKYGGYCQKLENKMVVIPENI
jgi:hypothetical protein